MRAQLVDTRLTCLSCARGLCVCAWHDSSTLTAFGEPKRTSWMTTRACVPRAHRVLHRRRSSARAHSAACVSHAHVARVRVSWRSAGQAKTRGGEGRDAAAEGPREGFRAAAFRTLRAACNARHARPDSCPVWLTPRCDDGAPHGLPVLVMVTATSSRRSWRRSRRMRSSWSGRCRRS